MPDKYRSRIKPVKNFIRRRCFPLLPGQETRSSVFHPEPSRDDATKSYYRSSCTRSERGREPNKLPGETIKTFNEITKIPPRYNSTFPSPFRPVSVQSRRSSVPAGAIYQSASSQVPSDADRSFRFFVEHFSYANRVAFPWLGGNFRENPARWDAPRRARRGPQPDRLKGE